MRLPFTLRTAMLSGVLLLAAAAALIPGSAVLRNREISFDGGLNAQVARSLAEKHRYASTYRGLHDFDHRVQTGPTVIVPTAVAFRLLGVNSSTAQLTNLAYMVAFFLLVVTLCWRLSGAAAAFLVIPLLLGTPHLFQLGMGLYGEIPALSFLLAGILVLDHSFRGSAWPVFFGGVLLGLAIVTKFQSVLPAGAVALTFLGMTFLHQRTTVSRLAALAGGVAAALLPMEIFRLHVLSTPVYLQWWRTMLGRVVSQGTGYRLPTTPAGPAKPLVHLGLLAQKLNLPLVLAVALVVLPPVLLAVLLRARRAGDRDDPGRRMALIATATAGLALTGWWLALSPTNHTWLRRLLNGLIPLEIVALVTIIELTRALWSRRCSPYGEPNPWRRSWTPAAAAVILLAQALSVLLWTWLPGLPREVSPSFRRSATGAMVDVINALPRDAVIYAKGWYEAPVLGALTGRVFLDLDQFPIDRYRKPMDDVYFIADAAMTLNQPDEIRGVLERSGAILVARKGPNSLYRLTILCPYPPIPRPPDPSRLLTVFGPADNPYPYTGGLQGASARAVCGVLLAREDLPCLRVAIWPSRRAGPNPVVSIRLDGREIWRGTVPGTSLFERTVPLPPPDSPAPAVAHVEIAVYRDGPPPPFLLWDRDTGTFTLMTVGFTGWNPGTLDGVSQP